MKETIYTIPISEVFEPVDGCPLCRMQRELEARCLDYILGAAMMEPDIRADTNAKGFCGGHYGEMLSRQKRLPLALMLQSRLEYVCGQLEKEASGSKIYGDCYVCGKVEWAAGRMRGTIYKLYGESEEFRQLYRRQTGLCLPHACRLLEESREVCGRFRKPFRADTTELAMGPLKEAKAHIDAFCGQFDYRNAHAAADESTRGAIGEAIACLTGRNRIDKV